MKPKTTILTLLALALSTLPVSAEEQPPITALMEYRAALKKGDVDRAIALTASFPKLPAGRVRAQTQEYSEATKEERLWLWIYPASLRVIEDCAVVVVGDHEKSAPDDPAYMIKQAGQWKVLLELTQWEREYFDFSEAQKKAFEQLSQHYESEEKRLRAAKDRQSGAK